eukprot:3134292-Prymnesium_polylepis.1
MPCVSVCVCYGSIRTTGRGTRTGHASGTRNSVCAHAAAPRTRRAGRTGEWRLVNLVGFAFSVPIKPH